MVEVRVISIGATSAHPLWGERAPVRTGHATTTLVRAQGAVILIDPGLPGEVLGARLGERAGLTPANVTHVFLTSFKPDVCRGIGAFDNAEWLIHDAEREAVGGALVTEIHRARDAGDEDLARALTRDAEVLRRCAPAPDTLAPGVDLFPLPGVTPGLCGVLIPTARDTTLITGDAVPTVEHLHQGKVPPACADLERARESLAEALEIADLLILGRDNLTPNPARGPF
ncbi:MAG: MBL fold metallo-hydrolase [Planctomycetota bacterium]|nr:MAG: MBL fold metallo-hydrolase [Planctomycetota bacterium]